MTAAGQLEWPEEPVDPERLVAWSEGSWHRGRRPDGVRGFSFDTRTLRSGECFVALRSEQRDGHGFVEAAVRRGAAAAMVERPVDADLPQLIVADSLLALGRLGAAARRMFAGPVTGITGSCGKTSTKEMLRLLLGAKTTHATAGNWNNRIGVPMTLLQLDPGRHQRAVIEAGINQPDEMGLLGEMIEADLGILTHIGPAHLELLGSLEGVATEKSGLFRRARSTASFFLPAACLRYDAFRQFANRATVVVRDDEAVPSGVADIVHLRSEPLDTGGQRLCLSEPGGSEAVFELASASMGAASNAALALSAARRLGETDADLRERLAAWRPGTDRGALRWCDGRLFYVDCYNANPASVADALMAFARSAPAGVPRLYVLGAMEELGPESEALHRKTALRLLPQVADRLLLVGPEEWTAAYREGALEAGFKPDRIVEAESAAGLDSEVAQFDGSVFLKGSRRHALEHLLPPFS